MGCEIFSMWQNLGKVIEGKMCQCPSCRTSYSSTWARPMTEKVVKLIVLHVAYSQEILTEYLLNVSMHEIRLDHYMDGSA